MIFEIVQVPSNRLPVETRSRIAHAVVDLVAHLDLEARQDCDHLAVRLHNLGRDLVALAVLRQELEEGQVAQVFFEVCALVDRLAIYLRHRQPVAPEGP